MFCDCSDLNQISDIVRQEEIKRITRNLTLYGAQ